MTATVTLGTCHALLGGDVNAARNVQPDMVKKANAVELSKQTNANANNIRAQSKKSQRTRRKRREAKHKRAWHGKWIMIF